MLLRLNRILLRLIWNLLGLIRNLLRLNWILLGLNRMLLGLNRILLRLIQMLLGLNWMLLWIKSDKKGVVLSSVLVGCKCLLHLWGGDVTELAVFHSVHATRRLLSVARHHYMQMKNVLCRTRTCILTIDRLLAMDSFWVLWKVKR